MSSLADWAELMILTGHSSGLSRARLRRILASDGMEDADVELSGQDSGEQALTDDQVAAKLDVGLDAAMDARIEQLLAEVSSRRYIAPDVYPFAVSEDRIVTADADGRHAYLLLLVLSREDALYREQKRAYEVEESYDRLSLEALRQYLGREAKGVRFARNSGDPDDPEHTRPKRFDEAIVWLREKLDLGPGVDLPPEKEEEDHWEFGGPGLSPLRSYSDAGVDVVVWWRFHDGRIGFPVLLAQCTVQLKWERKLKDVDPDLWRGWINFGTVPPQKCLVIPFAVDSDEATWPHRTVQAGVIIDRLRFIELLDELPGGHLQDLVEAEARNWIAAELAALS